MLVTAYKNSNRAPPNCQCQSFESSNQSYSSPRLLQVLKPMDFPFRTSFLCEGATMVLMMACELTISTPAAVSRKGPFPNCRLGLV